LGIRPVSYKARYSGNIMLHFADLIDKSLRDCHIRPNDMQISRDRKGALRVTFRRR
jgi:hypothetical protein